MRGGRFVSDVEAERGLGLLGVVGVRWKVPLTCRNAQSEKLDIVGSFGQSLGVLRTVCRLLGSDKGDAEEGRNRERLLRFFEGPTIAQWADARTASSS